jgi:NADH-quinone oxidoreductase subunit N
VSALLATAIATPHIDYLAIAPELILLGGALVILLATSMLRGGLSRSWTTGLALLTGAGTLAAALVEWSRVSSQGSTTTIAHAISLDGFSAFFSITVACALLLSTLLGHDYLARERIGTPEYHILALVASSGAVMMAQANDLIVVFLALEILSIALYVLVAFNPLRGESGEAALKYYVLGGFSSAVFVYGIALVYGATGTTNLGQLANYFTENQLIHSGLFDAGLALLLVGFAFKVAAVPFHVWTPDVYQGAPSPVTGFMAAVAKLGGFAALLRVVVAAMSSQSATWKPLLYALAVATVLLGSLVALVQRDVKRLLAYSSISHAGFVLVGVEVGSLAGTSAALYYLFTYALITVGAFGVVTLVGGPGDKDHDLTRYRGLARRQPWLGGALIVFLLAQAGIPFTTGFLAKLGVVVAAIRGGSWPLALIAMIAAAIGLAFYLRLVVLALMPAQAAAEDAAPASAVNPATAASQRTLLLEESTLEVEVPARVGVPPLSRISIGAAAFVTVLFGVIPGPLLDFAHQAALLFQA